jgi:hypothetical protein
MRFVPFVAFGVLLLFGLLLGCQGPGSSKLPDGTRADLRNGRAFIQDNLWSAGAAQYAVWVGDDGAPFAGRRARGGERWEIASLAALRGNPLAAPTARDEHNVYAIGVDAKGGVHVAGNMHNSPLRYVRSARPGSIGRWRAGPAPARGRSITYPAFCALPDGTLLFWRREGIAGHGAVLVDELDTRATEWRPLGTVLDGRPTGESPYLHHMAIDPRSGTIHLLFEWRRGAGVESNDGVGYARSRDGGRSWETSDGRSLATPITHSTAETVIDTPPGSGLVNGGGLTLDAEGRPHGVVRFDPPGTARSLEHVWLDDGRWERETLPGSTVEGRPAVAGTPDARVWLLGASGGRLVAVELAARRGIGRRRAIARVPRGWEAGYDSQALARRGRIETLLPKGDEPRVVEATLP